MIKILLLEEAASFVRSLDKDAQRRVLRVMDRVRSSQVKDPRLFKKLDREHDIWEFRIRVGNMHYRLLAFWDASTAQDTLVIATHGFIKKTSKIPRKEIEKAYKIKKKYLEMK
ncbi:MAG: type II toxin-antitoxin system RelE/ParE family toxin [Saprospiraceae bacterium]|nr:type II toxin-antitoxin system RelE/ParE family toxin [Saprospiraceae bacterium]MDW8228840.1 type II toxin-antitoxin system RelE/ParE family toxin [Saprospiraceae bacterium]